MSADKPKFDLYQVITDQVVEMLEKGVAPWRSPILGPKSAGWPRNLITGKPYRGVNVFLLSFTAYAKGYESSYWATYKQISDKGGKVKKGEKASMVCFWTKYTPKEGSKLRTMTKKNDKDKSVFVLRYYNVFNVQAQCEGIAVPDKDTSVPLDFSPIAEAEKIVAGFKDAPAVEYKGRQASWNRMTDVVTLPEQAKFRSSEDYYATLFHELGHSTGYSTRLNRDMTGSFGDEKYAREELIAEMTSAFLCGHSGITPTTLPNQTAYLASWIKRLKSDKKMIVVAAGAAQKAADYILGVQFLPAAETDSDVKMEMAA